MSAETVGFQGVECPAEVGRQLTFKRDELARFQRYVTDWEFREYARLV
ncbi:hypothetical protein AB0D24_37595 [Streptomyces javensis]